MIRLTALGGASEIGASCLLVEAFGARIVVDCGMRPKAEEGKYPDLNRLAAAGNPHAMVVTHAHIDHVGGLPLFHQRFPDVRLFATTPTIRITRSNLLDSVRIMEKDWSGSVDFRETDVEALARVFVPVEFRTPTVLVSTPEVRVTATLFRAGHILGAAMVFLEFEDIQRRIVESAFLTGDISLFDQPTIRGADLELLRGLRPTLCVCEGTYGDDVHGDLAREEARFVARVADVLRRGGQVLIPAFAVGRAQNCALLLREAVEAPARFRRLLNDPAFTMPEGTAVYLDGMCLAVTDQYSAFRDLLHPTLKQQHAFGTHVFFDETLRRVAGPPDRAALVEDPTPKVFIASSGMLTGGASVFYAQQLAKDPKHAILLSGYQDEEAPGGLLRKMTRAGEEAPVVNFGDQAVAVHCEVDQYRLSAHSDAVDIERLLAALQPERTVLVHGTPVRLARLARRLRGFLTREGLSEAVEVAHLDETIEAQSQERQTTVRFHATAGANPWAMRVLTGRDFHGELETSAVTPYITASLLRGRGQVLTGADVSRLETLASGQDPVAPEIAGASTEALLAGNGILWQETALGSEKGFLPVGPATPTPLPTLSKLARERARDAVVRSTRRTHDLPAQRARVEAMGIRPRDLILFVDSGTGDLRLLPAVVMRSTSFGFEVIAPGVVEPVVAVSQVVARVGRWPTLSTVPTAPSVLEMQLLEAIAHALSSLAAEHGDIAEAATRAAEHGELHALLHRLMQQGDLSPEAATFGGLLAQHLSPGARVRMTMAELVRLAGGPARIAPALIAAMLRELVDRQLLALEDHAGAMELAWVVTVGAARPTPPDADLVMRHLGRGFESVLRSGYARAVREVERLGLARRSDGSRWLGMAIADAPPAALPGAASPALPGRPSARLPEAEAAPEPGPTAD